MRHYLFKRPLNNIHMVLQACRLNRGRVLGVAPHLLHSTKLVIWTLTAFGGPNAQDPLGWWFYPGPNPLGGHKKWIEEKKNNKEEEKSRRKKEEKQRSFRKMRANAAEKMGAVCATIWESSIGALEPRSAGGLPVPSDKIQDSNSQTAHPRNSNHQVSSLPKWIGQKMPKEESFLFRH